MDIGEIAFNKLCNTCHVSIPVSEFWKAKSVKDGYTRHCKACGKMKNSRREKVAVPRKVSVHFLSKVELESRSALCSKCGPTTLSSNGKSKTSIRCGNAQRASSRAALLERRNLHRSRTDKIKNVPCADCGGSFPPYVMDFDHRPSEVKSFSISSQVVRKWDAVLAEIEKCDIVCANCHRIRTYVRRSE